MASLTPAAALLDLDGTLTDPYPGISACIRQALQQMGIPEPGPDQLRGWIGPPLLDSFARHFRSLGLAADPQLALSLYRERFASRGLFENSVYPGVAESLAKLRSAGLRLCLATSKPRVYALRIVAHFGLDAWLDECYGSELDGKRSDKVELLEYVLEHEGIAANCCAMIGDRRHDMEAARYHGLRAIGVLWGYGSREELLQAGAEALATEPAELPALALA